MKRKLIAVALLGVCVVLSVIEAKSQRAGTDFHARWLAGRWFWEGQPLYTYLPGVREPTYPPFAAMVFQVFALFPLKVAAGLFYFCNLLLIPVAVRLTTDVFDALWPDRPRDWWRLALAILFSAQFFLNNLNLVQVNLALLVLCLLGIRWYLAGHDVRGAAALVAATAIKLVPVFLVAWLVVRGRRRAALAVVPLGLACVALPMLQRGPATGARDLADYYHTLLEGFGKGRVEQRYTNQNLAASVYRFTRLPTEPTERDYRVVAASEDTARLVYRVVAALVVAAFLGTLVWLRTRGAPLTVFELSAAFLVGHLLSAMTWKAHLVTLLFVYYAFLSLRPRGFTWVILALMAIVGLTGRDLVGDWLHHAIGGYSVIVWMMLLMLGASLWHSRKPASA
jgi:alpha-1,2-mannosyltransferase